MLPPRYLAGLSDELVDIYSQLETDILRDMARRIARLGKASDMDKWQAQILAESGSLKADIEKKIRRYDKNVAATVKAVVQEALEKNTQNDNKIFLDALGRTVSTPTAQEILATVQKCYSDLSRLTLTTAATSQEAFVREANRAVSKVRSGAFTYDAAIKTAVDDLADAGVTTVQYENGKPVRRSIESAVRMNILTGINQTAAQVTLNNCDAVECDLVETSAHLGARPEHEEWQGQIFSRSGKNPNYRPFSVCGLGSPTGICGINCRHSFYPYFEGMEKEYTEKELDAMAEEKVSYNGKEFTRYEGEQALRSIERNIRLYKRVALTQDAAGLDNTKARQKIGEWQAKARDFTKQTGIERDSTRERIGTKGKQPTGLKPPTAKPWATKAATPQSTGGSTGGILDKTEAEQERFAKSYYQEIENRKSKSDIVNIARNTGFAEKKIAAVRDHIFSDVHLFEDGRMGKFAPDAKIALAWQRLEQNKAIKTDIILLNHEYTELLFMQKKGYIYEKAHWLSNIWNPWQLLIDGRSYTNVQIREIVRQELKKYL